MEQAYAGIALALLALVLLVGFFRKVNMGLLAIGAALVLGRIAGISEGEILAGFDAGLFMTLLGTSFLFCIAIHNGTLELFAKKLLSLAGNKTWLVPILFAIFAFTLSAVGPGNIPTGALTGPLAIVLSLELKLDPMFLCITSMSATNMGSLSRVANSGTIVAGLATDSGYSGTFETGMFRSAALSFVLLFGILYLVYRGHRGKPTVMAEGERLPPFTREQWITLIACGLMVVAVFALGVNVGLVAILLGVILLVLGISDEKAVLGLIPWGTLLLVAGVGMLMRLAIRLGGIDLLTDTLLHVMNRYTAIPVLSFCGGLIALFASAMGVVLPALVPAVPGILEALEGAVGYGEAVTALSITSLLATSSPVSSGGASTLARLDLFLQPTPQALNRIFLQMFLIAAAVMTGFALLSVTGFFGLFQ